MKLLAENCQLKKIHRLRFSRWSSLHRITSWPSPVSGISFVNSASSRRQPARLCPLSVSLRRPQRKSRTLASGCVTIRVRELTTCTVNIVIWPSAVLLHNATATWHHVIVLALTQFRWDFNSVNKKDPVKCFRWWFIRFILAISKFSMN